jgi:transcriptional regulator with XRE-family HTH domain
MTHTNGQLHLSLGALLSEERAHRGIALERAAKDTRMRAQRLREIEADDLSHFSSPSYARLFVLAYARYLGVPHTKIEGWLPEPGACGSEGFQYLSVFGYDYPPLRTGAVRRRPNGVATLLVKTVAVVATIAAVTVGVFLSINIPRLMADRQALDAANYETVGIDIEETQDAPASKAGPRKVPLAASAAPRATDETVGAPFQYREHQQALSSEVFLADPAASAIFPTREDDRSSLLLGAGNSATIQ